MKCSEFEAELARLAAEAAPGETASRNLEPLRRHAARCSACAGSRHLLDWLSLPAEERILFADPGPEYWGAFDRRLRARIRRESSRRRRLGWAATAAAAGLAGALLWAGGVFGPVPGLPRRSPVSVAGAPERGVPFPESLAKALEVAGPDQALSEADLMAGWDDAEWGEEGDVPGETATGDEDPGGWMVPSLGGLGEQERAELLRWLKEQRSAAKGDRA